MTRSTRLPGVLFAAICLLGIASNVSAQTFTWNTDAPGDWTTAANWNPVGFPDGQGDSAIFGSIITANRTVTLNANVAVGSIAFENTAFSYTIDGSGSLTLDNGLNPASIALASSVTANQTIIPQLIAQSDVNITNNSLTAILNLQGGLNLGAHILTLDGPGSMNFGNNGINGTTGSRLVLNGPGSVLLSAPNTGLKYEVNGGTLVANAALALQPTTPGILTPDLLTLTNGGTVNFQVGQSQRDFIGITLGAGGGRIQSNAAAPVILSGAIIGSGSLTKTGPQTIALAGLNNYTGETIIRNGTLRIDVNAPSGLVGALGMATSPVILGDNVGGNSTALFIGVNNVTIGRDITVVASPAPGTSTVTIGSRQPSGFDPVNGAFTGTLTLNRSIIIETRGDVSFGRITGTGDIAIEGSGNAVFTSPTSDFAGTISLNGGTLSINSDAQLGAATNAILFETGTWRITGTTPFSTNRTITLVPSGISGSKLEVLNTDTSTGFTINSAITGPGPFRKTGPGILTLSGANTNGSATHVDAGTLQVTAANVLSPFSQLVVHSGATVKLNGFSQQVASLANGDFQYTGSIDLGTTPGTVLTVGRDGVFTGGGSSFFDQNISGTGDLMKTGLGGLQLGGSRSYTGTTTVRQGNLEVHSPVPASGNGALGNSAGGPIRLGDANFSSLDASLLNADKTTGFARPITVVAGAGKRTLGHRLFGSTNNGATVAYSGPIVLEKDLHLYSIDHSNSDVTLRLNGVISGTGGLVKIGGGQAVLTADNTYTGTTTVLSGRLTIGVSSTPDAAARSSGGFIVGTNWSDPGPGLEIAHSPAPNDRIFAEFLIQDFAPNANRIGDVDVTLAQARFGYFGQDAGASSESFRNLIVDRSANTLELLTPVNVNTTSATLSMTGGLMRNNNGTLNVVATALGNPDGGDFTRILAASPPALVGGGGAEGSTNLGILPWAYHSTGPNGAIPIRNFLTYGATGLRPLTVSEYATSLTAAGTLNNVRITDAATTLSQDQTINSLFYDSVAAGTITLTGQTLTVNSGAILSRGPTLALDGGTLGLGTAEGIVHGPDFSDVTINSAITGSNGLTSHLGFGATLALNGVNTYTGPTAINSGHVSFNNGASFGSGADPIRLRWGWAGGTMIYTAAGATTLAKPIELGPSTNGLRLTSTGTLTLTGVISGTSLDPVNDVLTFSSFTGAGAFELRAANTFTGNVAMLSGTLGIVADNNLGPTTNRLTLGNGTASTAILRFDAAGITVERPIVLAGNSALRTTGQDAVISGPMSGGNQTLTLTKTGAGTLTLTGTHTFGAIIQITTGTLHVNGTLSPAGGNPSGGPDTVMVHVNNFAALGGSGTVHRLVRVNTGGYLDPGAGVGTLTLGALQFGSSATANYLWEAGATAQDRIMVTSGPVNLTGITVNLGLFDRGLGTNVTPNMQFPLLTVAGANSITGFNPANFNVFFTDTPNWTTGQFSLNVVQLGGNTSLVLSNISPVPEPAGLLAIAATALGLAAWRRRRPLSGGTGVSPVPD